MLGITCRTCSLGTTITRGVLVFPLQIPPLQIPRLINDIRGPEVKAHSVVVFKYCCSIFSIVKIRV